MLPLEVFANTSEEEVEIVTEICSRLREDPSLEPIIQFLTEDADNAPPPFGKLTETTIGKRTSYGTEGKLVVPDSETLKERLLKEFHDSPLAGHPGQQRTLELLSRNYWWPGMKSFSKEWVECCPTCQANCRAHALVIALKPLKFPLPFPHHFLQLYHRFPKSQGHDAILVVIDSFSKFGHFIPTSKKSRQKGLLICSSLTSGNSMVTGQNRLGSRNYLHRKVSKGTVPTPWSKTNLLFGVPPESDGQTERVNQFIEFYLRSYVAADHSNWAAWLPLAEYAYNNARHLANGETPFELVYGRNPVMNPSNVPPTSRRQTQ
ncbi:reverse transcriptase [Rhizoctonia solani]|uniref:Reverse transcriptase n=1 Tax=Rhizoctonia solani TaxID=456999 RepID=A0A8H7I7G8_9AGAM|nr:reverse transcriptase [Rhizoctonia solani]